jgi:hypothetical protein
MEENNFIQSSNLSKNNSALRFEQNCILYYDLIQTLSNISTHTVQLLAHIK